MERSIFPSDLAADLLACLRFYTRLPTERLTRAAFAREERSLADAQWAAPVVGLGIGLAVAVVLGLALAAGLPAGAAAVLALGAGILLTGALHEDGLADVADGFGGGKDRQGKLAIMKDSRNGTFGTLALGLSLLARWSTLAALAGFGWGTATLALIAAHAASRALLPSFMNRVGPARSDGLSAGLGRVGSEIALVALAVGAVLVLPLGFFAALWSVILLAALFLGAEWLCRRQIGGHTGDVLGALQQCGEIIVLFAAAATLA